MTVTSHHRIAKNSILFVPSTDDSSPSLSWSKKLTISTENCYSIQEGRVIERGLKGRYVSPIRIKNKHSSSARSTSPAAQSITSIRTVSSSTPTHQSSSSFGNNSVSGSQTLNWRILQRDKLAANGFDADKSGTRDENHLSDERGRLKSARSEFNRTVGGYSVPYREKRNPLSSTRLSCYKPLPDKKFDISNLKNYKSVDDFLSLGSCDQPEAIDAVMSMPFVASSKDLRNISSAKNSNEIQLTAEETPKMNQQQQFQVQDGSGSMRRMKKNGISGKIKSMSDKTHKLFSKFYSNSNLKSSSNASSSDVCSDFILQRPVKPAMNITNSRRSLSYGTLPGVNEFEIKKIETEDGDSGILINESGASSMIETDSGSDDPKTEIEQIKPQTILENCENPSKVLR